MNVVVMKFNFPYSSRPRNIGTPFHLFTPTVSGVIHL